MSFTQDFFTSRRNYDDGDTRVEKEGVLWYYHVDNTLRVGDGATPGGIILNSGGGGGGGSGYILPTASTTVKGGVKIDGTTITINNQVISGFSGNYNDLSNQPTIPTSTSQLTNNSGYITLSTLTWNNITGKPTFATVAVSGSYTDLTNKPYIFSGNYNDLDNKPALFSGNYIDLTNKPNLAVVATTGSYSDLVNKPILSVVATSGNYNDLTNKPSIPSNLDSLTDVIITSPSNGQVLKYNGTNWVNGTDSGSSSVAWNDITGKPTFATVATTGSYTDLLNKPALFSGSYNDLTNKPVLFSGNYNDLTNKPTIPAAQIQSDWNQTNTGALDFIKNKPSLFSGNYNDLTNKPTIPTTTNELTNDSGFITLSNLLWNNITGKPAFATVAISGSYNDLIDKPNLAGTYSWNITADDSTQRTISSGETVKIVGTNGVSTSSDSEGNITITGTTYDLTPYATITYVDQEIADLINSAPTTLDTLKELADALGSDANFSTTILNQLANKLDKNQQYKFSIAADDSTQREIRSGETIKLAGSGGITTSTDAEGNVTIHIDLDDLDSVTDRGNTTTNSINVGSITTTGDINPASNNIYYLGSQTNRWHSLYVGPGSVDIAGAVISNYNGNIALNSGIVFKDLSIQETAPHFFLAGQDSTVVRINNGESVKVSGTSGISTVVDSEGNLTITGPDLSPYATTSFVNTQINNLIDGAPQLLDTLNELAQALNDDANFASNIISSLGNKLDKDQQYKFSVAADDSTQRLVNSGESIKFVGGVGISTASDIEGNITISGFGGSYNDLSDKPILVTSYNQLTDLPYIPPDYYWNIAADDSSTTQVSNRETVKFIGANGVITSSDSEGNITITGTTYDLSPYATTTYVDQEIADLINSAPATLDTLKELADALGSDANFSTTILDRLANKLDKDQQYKFNVAADDSTQRTIGKDETIKFIGTNGVTTASDSEGNITITGTTYDLSPYSTQVYVNQELDKKLDKTQQYKFNVAADDSTTALISKDETLQIIGTRNVSTTINSEGKVTITGPDLTPYALTVDVPVSLNDLSDVQISGIPVTGYVLKWDGAKWSPAADATVGGSGTDADTLDGFDGSYYLDYTNLNYRPDLYLNIAGDDSTVRRIDNNQTIQFIGSTNISIATDANGIVTITGPDISAFATTSYVDTRFNNLIDGAPQLLDTLNELSQALNDDANFASNVLNNLNNIKFNVAADDSTVRTIKRDETIKFIGSNGVTTASDAEGNITITGTTYDLSPYSTKAYVDQELDKKLDKTQQYKFNVAADDSTQRTIGKDETIKFIGSNGVTTASDAEGNITITGTTYDLSPYATTEYVDQEIADLINSAPTTLDTLKELSDALGSDANFSTTVLNSLANKLDKDQQYKFSVAADDSTQKEISSGETLQIKGGTGTTTSVDNEGTITIDGFSGDYNDLTNKPRPYNFNIAADDSTAIEVNNGETIKIIGGNGITTASDSEGNITISGSTSTLDSVTDSGNITTNNITIGNLTTTGITSGTILPSSDNSYYLGSTSQRWHTLYVGPGSINIAGATISNVGGVLSFGTSVRFPDNTIQESASHFYIAGQDSTTVRVNNGQTIKISGTSNIITVVDPDGNITLTGPDLSPFATTNYVDTKFTDLIDGAPDLLNTLNELSAALNDDANFASNVITTLGNKLDINDRYRLYIAADDSTTIEILRNSTIQFKGGTGINTQVDTNGIVTITGFSGSYNDLTDSPDLSLYQLASTAFNGDYNSLTNRPYIPPEYKLNIAADDSTVISIQTGETVKFIGTNGVTTSSDSEGNITITGTTYDLTPYATITYVDQEIADLINSAPTTLDTLKELADALGSDANFSTTILDRLANKLDKTDQYKFSIAADDSTQRLINSGESIKFIGGTGITTSSDSEGNITINGLGLTVSLIDPLGTITEQTANVKALRFDTESAFDLTDLGNGEVKVQMNSTFKYWKVDGQQDLVATGLDTIRFEAGQGISITTDPNASPYQTLKISGFSGNYNDLSNKPEQYKFSIAADDSTQKEISSGEVVKFIGGIGISTSSDSEGNITIDGFSGDYDDLANKPSIPVNTSDLVNDSGFIDSSALNGLASEQFVLNQGYLKTSSWNISADDSVSRTIENGETVKISGSQGITTSSDSEGNITIEGPDLPDLASVDIDTSSPIPVGYVLKWNGTKWAPAIDDTSETAGTLQVYDEGSTHFTNVNTMNFKGTGVTVSDSGAGSVDVNINTDFIGFNIDGGRPDSIYGGINPIDAGHI